MMFVASELRAEIRFTGTFIAAAVCQDGIVVASDSRSTFIDDSGRPFAYIDGVPKIFVNNGAAVAISGLSSMGDELLTSFVRRKAFLLDRSVEEILFGFAVNLPFRNTTAVGMLSAGFNQGMPRVCGKTPFDPQRCTHGGYFANKSSAVLRDSFAKLARMPTANEAASIIRQAIQAAASADISIGGPISILHLRESDPPVWLENEPQDHGWSKICDMVSAYRQGRAPIRAISSPEVLRRHLDGVCPR
jgi:20S proteasome alpha/beta subunit